MKTIQINNITELNKTGRSCCAPPQNPGLLAPDLQMRQKAIKAISSITAEKPPWIIGTINTEYGLVPVVSPDWSHADRWGHIRSRMSAFRMNYAINPGLYAIGTPDADSDIFVSANYKFSFDILRRELMGINGWILVLDTKGINLWCAAGKANLRTDALVRRIT